MHKKFSKKSSEVFEFLTVLEKRLDATSHSVPAPFSEDFAENLVKYIDRFKLRTRQRNPSWCSFSPGFVLILLVALLIRSFNSKL